jgi:hypothetical protein
MEWWIVPEGILGQIVNGFSNGPSTINTIVHAVQASARPRSAVGGPFTTETEADAAATDHNNAISGPLPQQIAQKVPAVSGVTDFLTRLTEPSLWMRVFEGAVGGFLILAAANHMMSNPAGKIGKIGAMVK